MSKYLNLNLNRKLTQAIKKEAPMSKSQGVLPSEDNIPQSNTNVKSDTSSTRYSMQENNLLWKTFFEMLYYSGTRVGEAKALTWNDTDFTNIRINKSVFSKLKRKKYIITNPKTNSSVRTIPIPKVLTNDLKLLFEESKKIYEFNNSMFIFGGSFPLADTTIQKRKNELCKKANVKQIRIHDFRHSTASLLINSGANITLVAKYLGHSNIATTLNTYSHFYKSELNDIVNIINNKKISPK